MPLAGETRDALFYRDIASALVLNQRDGDTSR